MLDRLGGSASSLAGIGLGVVLGCAVLFGLIGAIRGGDTPDPDIADGPTPAATAPADDGTAQPSIPADDGTGSPTPTPSDPATVAPTPTPTAEPTPTEAPTFDAVEPGTVSVQVLDATGGSDTGAADAVAAELRSAGYNVVVVNRASKTYDATTLFWSTGQEAAGRQIAAAFDIGVAMATPTEVQLSDAVSVHVVVGTDRT